MARYFAWFFGLVLLGTSAAASAQRPIPVHVQSTPPGAAVYVDSAEGAPIGTTPLRNVRIPRGSHTLIFRLASHEEARLTVNIRRRRETFTATLNPLGTISLVPANDSAQNAAVRMDGAPVGNLPHRMEVQPGRHLVQVGREGYVTFSQWVELAGGQVLSLPIMLERDTPETGSLLVAGDVSGAAIYVDGTPRGATPTVIDGLTAGNHLVEVRPNDSSMETFSQTVRIIAGERMNLNPVMRAAPAQAGSLRVLCNVPTAEILFDGELVGNPPASQENIPPGDHIVEARAEGYQSAQQPVSIDAGQQRVISITLTAVAAAPGRIVVNANVDNATVSIDGEERGAPPVVLEGAPAGTHAVIVRAPGHQEHRETCRVGPGENCTIDADLQPVGTPVRVEANVTMAEFYVDGELQGPVPWEGTVPTGSHLIEVRADGHRSYQAQVALSPQAEPRVFNVGLVGEDELTPEENREMLEIRRERHRQAVSRSGATLPNDLAVLDVSVGWPYLFELRMGIGILDWLEAGIGIRTTFYRLTEFEGRVKAGWRPARQVSLGAQIRLGGGLGPAQDAPTNDPARVTRPVPADPFSLSTNSFFFSLEALFSLHFLNAGNFTLWAALDVHRDSWAFSGSNNDCRWTACVDSVGGLAQAPDAEELALTQSIARFRIGGSLEFIVSNKWNVWGSFEGTFGDDRRILGDMWGLGNDDISIYGRLGLTYKFGYTDREEDRATALANERDEEPALAAPPAPAPAADPATAPAQ